MLDVVCYILVVGIGLAILFSCNAASGGLDIVAKIMNKYLHMELGQAMAVSGILVALSSARAGLTLGLGLVGDLVDGDDNIVAGTQDLPLSAVLDDAVQTLKSILELPARSMPHP